MFAKSFISFEFLRQRPSRLYWENPNLHRSDYNGEKREHDARDEPPTSCFFEIIATVATVNEPKPIMATTLESSHGDTWPITLVHGT